MSTRSQWSFRENGKQIALIYKHSDGYPDGESGGFAVWNRFIDKIVNDAATGNYGYRFDDAEYLAARFVVFLAVYENKENNLAFGGIGVSKELHGDIEYLYEIDCDNSNVPAFRCKSVYSGNYSGKYVNEHNLEMSKHGNKPKGSITIKNKTFASLSDVKLPLSNKNTNKSVPCVKKQCSNDSHLKLKRNSLGHFIRMDDIAEFKYPHNDRGGYCQLDWRQVKVIKEVNNTIEGIQCNGDNTGYKRFDKSKMVDIIRYRGYIKAGDWS